VVSPKSKLTKAIKKPKAIWVEPKFCADIEYRGHHLGGLASRQFVQKTFAERLVVIVASMTARSF
jgi:hypothetical protein